MVKRARYFIFYSWATVFLWYAIIWLLSSASGLDFQGSYFEWIISGVGYQLAFGLLFLLIFRAILVTFKLKVDRLMYWKSKREKSEDEEFAKVTEILILFLVICLSTILAIVDEFHQFSVPGRVGSIEDVLLDLMGIIVAAALVFAAPIISELEARLAKVK